MCVACTFPINKSSTYSFRVVPKESLEVAYIQMSNDTFYSTDLQLKVCRTFSCHVNQCQWRITGQQPDYFSLCWGAKAGSRWPSVIGALDSHQKVSVWVYIHTLLPHRWHDRGPQLCLESWCERHFCIFYSFKSKMLKSSFMHKF